MVAALAFKVEGMADFERKVRELAEMPNMIVSALNGTVSDTVDELYEREIAEIEKAFEKPTPWLKKGIIKLYPSGRDVGVKTAQRARGGRSPARFGQTALRAGITVEEFPTGRSQADVLAHHIHSGMRSLKRNEQRINAINPRGNGPNTGWVLGRNWPRDQYGNIAGHWYSKALHEIRAMEDTKPTTKSTQRGGFVRNKSGGKGFFIPRNKPYLILERTGKKNVRVFLVANRSGSPGKYQKRFDYFGVGRSQVEYSLPLHFNRVFNRYIEKMGK